MKQYLNVVTAYAIMLTLIILVGIFQSWSQALSILNYCLISAVMTMGANIQWGYAGLINFGIMGYTALGGLAVVLVSVAPVPEAWKAGGLNMIGSLGIIAAIIGAAFGYPSLRLKGSYFAIVTLILNIVVRQIILVTPEFSGGSSGFRIEILPPDPIPLPFTDSEITFTGKATYYYLIWILGLIAVGVCYWIDHSRFGATLRAIRQSDALAQSVGINIATYKLIAFVIACFFAGLAGSFYTHYLILAHPDAFTMWDSIFVVAYVVIGGIGTVLGPIIGTIILVGGFELLRELSNYQTVGYALILLLVTRFLPGGLISFGPMIRDQFEIISKWIRKFNS